MGAALASPNALICLDLGKEGPPGGQNLPRPSQQRTGRLSHQPVGFRATLPCNRRSAARTRGGTPRLQENGLFRKEPQVVGGPSRPAGLMITAEHAETAEKPPRGAHPVAHL